MNRMQFSNYRQVYGLLFRTYGKNGYIRLSFVMAFISRACKYIGLPIAASQIIASLAAQDYSRGRTWVLVFALFSATIGILAPTTKYVALLGENTVYENVVKDFFKILLNKDVSYFNESMTGYITTATRQYGDNTIDLQRQWRENYLSIIFGMIAPIIVICIIDIGLGLMVLALSLIQASYLLWASQKIVAYRKETRETFKRNSGLISDSITNIVAIKATAQEKAIAAVVGEGMFIESQLFMKRYKLQAKLTAVREAITVSFFLLLFWVTVTLVSSGSLDIAAAVLVVTYSFTILTAVYDLSNAVDKHDDYVDLIIPAFDLFITPNRVLDPKKPRKMSRAKGAIKFNSVTFAYDESGSSIDVFKDLNIDIPAGQRVGIVGLSGAGKSTLAKLLLRFEDIQSGTITVDGLSIKEMRQTDLRRNIAYVPQEPLLFHNTIRENIKLAKLDATDEEVTNAARSAYALPFIDALPRGLDSVVGERGVKLSGGQKQRIAIARAVLQDAPIVLLDEATSALDSESEQIIKESFATILKGRTAIVIAHRLSTIADLDRIVLLHEGRIVEDGTHTSLLKKRGIYYKLWNRQRVHPEDLEIKDSNLDRL